MKFTRFLALFFVGLVAWSLWISYHSPLLRALRQGKAIGALIVGLDAAKDPSTDVMIAARYWPQTQRLDLLFLPPQTHIKHAQRGADYLGQVYPRVLAESGSDQLARQALVQTLNQMVLSTAAPAIALNLDYIAQINFSQFKNIVDALLPIQINVDSSLKYDDSWAQLHIHISSGAQQMQGQQALDYVRFTDGDIYARWQRQALFVLSFCQHFKHPLNIILLPYWAACNWIKTDLNYLERLAILLELKNVPLKNIRLLQVPIQAEKNFWMINSQNLRASLDLLNQDASTKKQQFAALVARPGQMPSVEVWNASGRRGLAQDVVRRLRQGGFDVVKWGNYPGLEKRSRLLDRKGRFDQTQKIQTILNTDDLFTLTCLDLESPCDFAIVLGEHFDLKE